MTRFIIAAFVVLSTMPWSAQETRTSAEACVQPGNRNPRLLPVDEGGFHAEFAAYRARLQAAVARRDIDAVIAEIDPGIRLGFDASGGVAAFRTLVVERVGVLGGTASRACDGRHLLIASGVRGAVRVLTMAGTT
jgi:hypothetical protein